MNITPPGAVSQIQLFDRALVRSRRDRAAPSFDRHQALFDATADILVERLDDVTRLFSNILDLGAHQGRLAQRLQNERKGSFVVAADLSEKLVRAYEGPALAADEETLPFAAESFDLIVSNLSLHWVNDLPGALVQIKQALRPGGLFLAAMLGGDTLHELRDCLIEAETLLSGGISPRLSPTVSLVSASALMQRAGFALPVVDHELCLLAYRDLPGLMRDLRGMGETSTHRQRLKILSRRALFAAAAALYQRRYAVAGRVQATFDVVFLHGWKS